MNTKFVTLISWVFIGFLFVGCTSASDQEKHMTKKDIMDRFVAGELETDYIPGAFFVHFPKDAKVGQAAVDAHLSFYNSTNPDILKVQFEQSLERIKDLDKQQTWDLIKPIPVDYYRPTLEVIRQIVDSVGDKVYVLPTIYSPYQVARQSLKDENIAKAAVERRDDLKRVMGYYAEALEWLVDSCKAIGVEGFYMTTQGGEMKYNDIRGFFDDIIKPYDLRVMNHCIDGTKMNILHICDWEGTYDDLTRYVEYPGDIINTPNNLNGQPFTLNDEYELFKRPVLGGLERKGAINTATVEEISEVVDQAIAQGPKGHMMLGAECTVSKAPVENIQAAIARAHKER